MKQINDIMLLVYFRIFLNLATVFKQQLKGFEKRNNVYDSSVPIGSVTWTDTKKIIVNKLHVIAENAYYEH